MKRLSLILLIFLLTQTSFASEEITHEWIKTFDGFSSGDDRAVDMTINGSDIYVTGHSYHDSAGSASYDIVTIKYNTNGDILWISRFDNGPNLDDFVVNLRLTGNSLYLVGYSAQNSDISNPNYDITVLNLDLYDGSLKWEKQYDGGYQLNDSTISFSHADYFYISATSQNLSGFNDIFSIKITTAGDILSTLRYSDPNSNDIRLSGSFLYNIGGSSKYDLYLFGSVDGLTPKSLIVKYDSLGNFIYSNNIVNFDNIDDLDFIYLDTVVITSSYRLNDLVGNKVALLDTNLNVLWSKNCEINSVYVQDSLLKSQIVATPLTNPYGIARNVLISGSIYINYRPRADLITWCLDVPSPLLKRRNTYFLWNDYISNNEQTMKYEDSYYGKGILRWYANNSEDVIDIVDMEVPGDIYVLGNIQESSSDFMLKKYSKNAYCCIGPFRGDVDGTEIVDIDDVVYLVQYCFGFPAGPEPVCLDEADADASGRIDIDDILTIIEYGYGSLAPTPADCP